MGGACDERCLDNVVGLGTPQFAHNKQWSIVSKPRRRNKWASSCALAPHAPPASLWTAKGENVLEAWCWLATNASTRAYLTGWDGMSPTAPAQAQIPNGQAGRSSTDSGDRRAGGNGRLREHKWNKHSTAQHSTVGVSLGQAAVACLA
jgi:hypothetical protein